MRKFYRMMAAVTGIFFVLLLVSNVYIQRMEIQDKDRIYRVSINRIRQEISRYETGAGRIVESLEQLKSFDGTADYPYITAVKALPVEQADAGALKLFYENEQGEYAVVYTGQAYYKILYDKAVMNKSALIWIVNGMGVLFLVVFLVVVWYIRIHILKPFEQMSELPGELAKGNLAIPLKEERSGYFGQFVWGMDMLREKLEKQRERELELHRERKLLLLSLSHDIKTPLSALKLYAKALGRNLYHSPDRQKEIAARMDEKVDEMEAYIADIVQSSREDFLDFEVHVKEIYIRDVLEYIREYYEDKMSLNQIVFEMGAYSNCLVLADRDRLVEVLQNVLENAVKYGDGRRISISMDRGEEEFLIHICNTGCTLEKKELTHIYDSFFRGTNAVRQAGSGLGLYICRELLHCMDGEITAYIRESDQERIMEVCIAVRMAR